MELLTMEPDVTESLVFYSIGSDLVPIAPWQIPVMFGILSQLRPLDLEWPEKTCTFNPLHTVQYIPQLKKKQTFPNLTNTTHSAYIFHHIPIDSLRSFNVPKFPHEKPRFHPSRPRFQIYIATYSNRFKPQKSWIAVVPGCSFDVDVHHGQYGQVIFVYCLNVHFQNAGILDYHWYLIILTIYHVLFQKDH